MFEKRVKKKVYEYVKILKQIVLTYKSVTKVLY